MLSGGEDLPFVRDSSVAELPVIVGASVAAFVVICCLVAVIVVVARRRLRSRDERASTTPAAMPVSSASEYGAIPHVDDGIYERGELEAFPLSVGGGVDAGHDESAHARKIGV